MQQKKYRLTRRERWLIKEGFRAGHLAATTDGHLSNTLPALADRWLSKQVAYNMTVEDVLIDEVTAWVGDVKDPTLSNSTESLEADRWRFIERNPFRAINILFEHCSTKPAYWREEARLAIDEAMRQEK